MAGVASTRLLQEPLQAKSIPQNTGLAAGSMQTHKEFPALRQLNIYTAKSKIKIKNKEIYCLG